MKEEDGLELYQQTLEMRGQRRQAFIDYFNTIDGNWIDATVFYGKEWSVHVSEEQTLQLGRIAFPVVFITFQAQKEVALALIQAFRLRFLSAGG